MCGGDAAPIHGAAHVGSGASSARDSDSFGSGFVQGVAAAPAPATTQTRHATYVELFGHAVERVAVADVATAGRRRGVVGDARGCTKENALSSGRHFPRRTSDASDANVSGRNESAEDMRRHFVDVSEK